jgi:hypothetical protein
VKREMAIARLYAAFSCGSLIALEALRLMAPYSNHIRDGNVK